MRWAPVAMVLMALSALGCNGSQSAADACIAAGGQCVLGPATNCAKLGNSCLDVPNPGGSVCCFEFVNAGDGAAEADIVDGAAEAAAGCTPGHDETCNDDPTINSIHGTCLQDHSCSCSIGPGLNAATGKCR